MDTQSTPSAQPAPSAQPETASNSTWPPGHPYGKLKDCDVVMKGGITSGVVYPRAVGELAKTYRLHSVGGTSAGAIAAAAAAAAELRRWHSHDNAGFATLETLPTFLGQVNPRTHKSNLFAFFQPQPKMQPLFETAVAFLGDDAGRLKRVVQAAIRSFPLAALIGALPALLLFIVAFDVRHWGLGLTTFLLAALVGLFGVALALTAAFGLRALRGLKENYFGFCTGMPAASGCAAPSLTVWLADYLDDVAGVTDPRTPLTFGDLRWGRGKRNPNVSNDEKPNPHREPAINLRMIATNLTVGRPYTLPFETRIFYFDPEEWRSFFPTRVIDWMIEQSPKQDGTPSSLLVHNKHGRMLLPLPEMDELPVVVATRMSLSFPILLSAIPLYMVDFTRTMNQQPRANGTESGPRRVTAERCWFSDGGIAVNFPIHFFDRPLPRWPTFAINLSVPHPDFPIDGLSEEQKIWMPKNNRQGQLPPLSRFKASPNHAALFDFLASILYTARTWMDQTQMMSPGYRDRTVHINLTEDEGGLNLNMPDQMIKSLATRGSFAGKRLVKQFTSAPQDETISWDNHRWIRLRSSMTLIEELLEAIEVGYSGTLDGERTWQQLLERGDDVAPTSYPWLKNEQVDQQVVGTETDTGETDTGETGEGVNAVPIVQTNQADMPTVGEESIIGEDVATQHAENEQRQLALYCVDTLIQLARAWRGKREKFETNLGKGTPRPKPEMQIRARI